MNKNKRIVQSIKIKSIQANSLYLVNNYKENSEEGEEQKKPYLDLGEAVINDSLFADYMKHHGVVVNSRGRSKDFVVMKFDFGVKDGMSAAELRDYYYKNGATVTWKYHDTDGNVIHEETIAYKMLMRSPGKAKEGDCIFIREKFHSKALKYLTMDLWDKMPLENAPIVEMSAYAPLTTATAIDYITIPMENILVVKDEDVYTMVNAVRVRTKQVPYEYKVVDWKKVEEIVNEHGLTFYKKKQKENPELQHIRQTKKALDENRIKIEDYPLKTKIGHKTECYVDRSEGKTEVKNTLWDGMGLCDEEIFPQNKGMDGFIYCRSHFFKSCLFRANIQEYFKDYFGDAYETATVVDMFGNEFKAKDIKVIITENSIKWIKFVHLISQGLIPRSSAA